TEDASRETCLPANDSMWDSGVSLTIPGGTSRAHNLPQDITTNEPLLVSSSANAQAGNFARLAQASHLLGRVIRHTNDLPTDVEFRLEEARQLDRTIRALYKLLPGKGTDDSIGSCTPLAVSLQTKPPPTSHAPSGKTNDDEQPTSNHLTPLFTQN
ncbi:hypothetical protein GP486_008774, partial [Trichoglossum hirsutum]